MKNDRLSDDERVYSPGPGTFYFSFYNSFIVKNFYSLSIFVPRFQLSDLNK